MGPYTGYQKKIVECARWLSVNGCYGYLLQNHGALTLGSNLEEAWLNVELLEKTARIYITALSTDMGTDNLVFAADL